MQKKKKHGKPERSVHVNVSFNIDTGCSGSFRKIVKRRQKLMVEKFEGHHYSCSHTSHSVCKFQGGGSGKGGGKG